MDADDSVPPSVAAAGPGFRQAFLTLRRQYADNLPRRLQEASDALDACLRQPQDAAALDILRRAVHTMAGTAPTLGFVQQGEQARRIEHLLQPLGANPARTAADFADAQAAVAELVALGATR